MYSVMGVTGQVGGSVVRNLLAGGKHVRAIVRDAIKAAEWKEKGCELAFAKSTDADALAKAFQGAEGAFVMLPPIFDPQEGFPEVYQNIEALYQALLTAQPKRAVVLSTIGAHVTRPNLLRPLHDMEQKLGALPMPTTFLRAGWFMENFSWDVTPAKETGVVPSFLHPLDKRFPMIATEDIGRIAAKSLIEGWDGHQVVELEGPKRISPNEVAAAFSRLFGREIRMQVVPRNSWGSTFKAFGMKNPTPRMQMLDGFNDGWIDFEHGEANSIKGRVSLDQVLSSLLQKNQ